MTMRLLDARYVNPNIRVFLNGQDVSKQTTLAYVPAQSDVEDKGWVDMVQFDEDGFGMLDENGVDLLIKRIEGKVKWVMG